jgi:2'-5' RNA ligase
MAGLERKEPDRWGYTRYAVVLFLAEEERRKVDTVRVHLPIPVAMIPAHVTVKGSFDSPGNLDEVRRCVREVASSTRPFDVELVRVAVWGKTVVYEAAVSPEIRTLHDALYDAIEPVTRNVYGDEAGERFRPHMTVCQELPAGAVEEAERLARALDIAKRFRIGAMQLMALVGPRHGGHWEMVEEFPFVG